MDEEGLKVGEKRKEEMEPRRDLVMKFPSVLNAVDVGLDVERNEVGEGQGVGIGFGRDEDLSEKGRR